MRDITRRKPKIHKGEQQYTTAAMCVCHQVSALLEYGRIDERKLRSKRREYLAQVEQKSQFSCGREHLPTAPTIVRKKKVAVNNVVVIEVSSSSTR